MPKDLKQLTDDEIVEGFRQADERIVKEYFYGYCRIAYIIYDKRYDLQYKPGMDFFSLAHEYYIALFKKGFKQLENRKDSMSLKTWMVNGFRFLLLDKLKELEKEQRFESFESRLERTNLQFDVVDHEYAADFRNMVGEICRAYYGRDNKNSIILQMLFVEGFKSKEIAAQLGMSPSAVTQRYNHIMHDVVVPYFKKYYVENELGIGSILAPSCSDACMDKAMKSPAGATNLLTYLKCAFMDDAMKSPAGATYSSITYKQTMDNSRITPERINQLNENEIFVFGSNLEGMHGGGAARTARLYFGAKMGVGVGMQGQSYAIPTMQGGVDTISPYVDDFIDYAATHPDKRFLVTAIGCGIAGFEPSDIAPLFVEAKALQNVTLPESFWEIIEN